MTNSETLEFSPTSTNDEEEERSNIFSNFKLSISSYSYVKITCTVELWPPKYYYIVWQNDIFV